MTHTCTGRGDVDLKAVIVYEPERVVVLPPPGDGDGTVDAASVFSGGEDHASMLRFELEGTFRIRQQPPCQIESILIEAQGLVTGVTHRKRFTRDSPAEERRISVCVNEPLTIKAKTSDGSNVEWDLGGLAPNPTSETTSEGIVGPVLDSVLTKGATPGTFTLTARCDDDPEGQDNLTNEFTGAADSLTVEISVVEPFFVDFDQNKAERLKVAFWPHDPGGVTAFQNTPLPSQAVIQGVKVGPPGDNFVDLSSDRFTVRLVDSSRNLDPAKVDSVGVVVSTFRARDEGGENLSRVSIQLTERGGPNTGFFESDTLILVSNFADSQFPPNNTNQLRTRSSLRASVGGRAVILYTTTIGTLCESEVRVCHPPQSTKSFPQRTIDVHYSVLDIPRNRNQVGGRDRLSSQDAIVMREAWAQGCMRFQRTGTPPVIQPLANGLRVEGDILADGPGSLSVTINGTMVSITAVGGSSSFEVAKRIAEKINSELGAVSAFAFNYKPVISDVAHVIVGRGRDTRLAALAASIKGFSVTLTTPTYERVETEDEEALIVANFRDADASTLDYFIVPDVEIGKRAFTIVNDGSFKGGDMPIVIFLGGASWGTPFVSAHEAGHALMNDGASADNTNDQNLMNGSASGRDSVFATKRLTPEQVGKARENGAAFLKAR